MSKKMTVPCIAARHYAVKKVNASAYTFDYIAGRAYTHKIPRFLRRHIRLNSRNDTIHIFLGFADGKPAYGISVKIQIGNLFHIFYAQIIKSAPLIDSE